jgi:hypothetical protein
LNFRALRVSTVQNRDNSSIDAQKPENGSGLSRIKNGTTFKERKISIQISILSGCIAFRIGTIFPDAQGAPHWWLICYHYREDGKSAKSDGTRKETKFLSKAGGSLPWLRDMTMISRS